MDPLDRADALLSRAQSRGAFVVTPESAVSPMDAANTQQIPRSVVNGADDTVIDPDATTRVTYDEIREHDDADRTQELGPPAGRPADPDPEPEPTVEVEELGGLIPTTKQTTRSNVSRRLDG